MVSFKFTEWPFGLLYFAFILYSWKKGIVLFPSYPNFEKNQVHQELYMWSDVWKGGIDLRESINHVL